MKSISNIQVLINLMNENEKISKINDSVSFILQMTEKYQHIIDILYSYSVHLIYNPTT